MIIKRLDMGKDFSIGVYNTIMRMEEEQFKNFSSNIINLSTK
jgi:hypothetical protein